MVRLRRWLRLISLLSFADARELGEAHLRACESPEAADQRFLTRVGKYMNQMLCDFKFPDLKDWTPRGDEAVGLNSYTLDTTKAKSVLGLGFMGSRSELGIL
jgi:hypothetical protein